MPSRWREILFLALLIFSIWIPRVLGLKQFVTIDEPLWVTRSANFYCALSKGNFANTFQREHPGVTTMWVGLLGYLWEAPDYIMDCPDDVQEKHHEETFRAMGLDPLELLAAGRFFSILVVTLTLVVGFLYARRLLGFWTAWLGFMLIAFDPFHAGLSHLLHIDGLSSSFILLTLLAFSLYLRDRRSRDLIISGIAAGLSCLAKSPAFFLFPFMGLLIAWDWVRAFGSSPDSMEENLSLNSFRSLFKPPALKASFYSVLLPWFFWAFVGFATFFLLWPSMWVDPLGTLTQVFDKANHYAAVGHRNPIFFNGQVIEDGNLGLQFYYFYPLTYLWRATPGVLIGLLSTVVAWITRTGPFNLRQTRRWIVDWIVFVLLFTLMMTFGGKKFDRYLLPVYPVLDLVAALGWVSVGAWLAFVPHLAFLKKGAFLIPVGIAVLGQCFPLVRTFPYYLSYYNPLMGGSRKAPDVMQIGWGEGLDQAARYLNTKPNADTLEVFSWYEPGSFSYYFDGISDVIPARHELEDVNWGGAFFNSDAYVVTYIHQRQRRESWHLIDYLETQIPEQTIWINGLEYARIYRLRSRLDFYSAPTYQQVDLQLGDQILLEGYNLSERTAEAGTSLQVALSWRALEPPDERLKVFVHLMDVSGQVASQSDGEPMVAFRPTDGWRAGEQIPDHYKVLLPLDLSPGTYTLYVGMYRANGERLPMMQQGQPVGDAFSLGSIEVVRGPK